MDDRTNSFGYWLRRRRKALDLTQEALAQSVSCSRFAIRKIEADERRPSRRLAERLAEKLAIPDSERRAFLEAARAERSAQRLDLAHEPLAASTEPSREPLPFVGRSNEYGQLIGLMARLTAGTGHVVLIEGEPGIGKSRLMREVARYARGRGLCTLAARCYEIDRAMPYQPVVELVTQALELAPTAGLEKLSPVALAEIAALVPGVAERIEHLPPLSADFPEARKARLFQAIVQLFEVLSGSRQLVVTLDDLQWADDASAQFMHYFARRAAHRPMLVLCAYRDEELETDERLASFTASLRSEAHARHLRLEGLQRADTEALLKGLADPQLDGSALADRLQRETDGNPFFLASILHSLGESETALGESVEETPALLPDALRSSVRARLARVPVEIRPLLDVAAVFGRRFDFETLLAVAREPEERVLRALEALVKRRLLREEAEAGLYDFSHDKVREVVYRDIGATRRTLLHRAVAETLEARGESEPHERDARLAEHYERAHAWTKALSYLVLAAERSQKLFALRDALHWLDRAVVMAEAHPEALDERGRLALYGRRGAARAQAGLTQGAVADIGRVRDAARSRADRAQERDALIQLGMAYRRADAYEKASACLIEALEMSRSMSEEKRAADTLYHLGTVAWSNGRNRQAIAFHQEAVEICERLGLEDLVAVQAYHGRGEAHFSNCEPAQAIACYTRSLELARAIGDKSYESENLMMIGHACLGYGGVGDYPRAIESFEAALAIARAADLQWHIGPTLLGLDHARACQGRYAEAWTGMCKTLRWLEGVTQPRYQLIAYDFMGHLLLDVGLHERAAAHLERGLGIAREANVLFWRPRIQANLALARLRLGRHDVGPVLEGALASSERDGERYATLRCLEALAELALARGEASQCAALAERLLSHAQANGLREIAAQARRWRGEALLAQRAIAPAREELSSVVASAAEIGRPKLACDAHDALARLHELAGEHDAARNHRARARELAATLTVSLD